MHAGGDDPSGLPVIPRCRWWFYGNGNVLRALMMLRVRHVPTVSKLPRWSKFSHDIDVNTGLEMFPSF